MKTQKTKTNKEIRIPILNDEYSVIVCWGDIKYIEGVLKAWGHGLDGMKSKTFIHSRGATFYYENCHPIIVLIRKPKTPEEIGTLAHEACHAVVNIFNKISELEYDEVFAHSVGAVVRKVLSTK